MRFGSKTHAQMSSRMTRLQGLRWIKGIAIRFSISPLPVENELDRPPQMSSGLTLLLYVFPGLTPWAVLRRPFGAPSSSISGMRKIVIGLN